MAFPLVAAILGLAKLGTDLYQNEKQDRYEKRLRERGEENEKTQKRNTRRSAIMRALGVNAPIKPFDLQDVPEAPDLSSARTLSGLLGFGAQASMYGGGSSQTGTDVPMPYQGKTFQSKYGPGSQIKPGAPYQDPYR